MADWARSTGSEEWGHGGGRNFLNYFSPIPFQKRPVGTLYVEGKNAMTGESGPPEGRLWTVQERAVWLRLTTGALRCRVQRGQLPPGAYLHLGRTLRFIPERVKGGIWRKAQ